MNYKEGSFSTPDNTLLYSRLYENENAQSHILLVHGFGEHSGRYEALIAHLLGKGHSVTVYDQRGHGKSAGLYGHVDRFAQYEEDLDFMVSVVNSHNESQKLFLVAHSMGGLVALRYLMRQPWAVMGAVISAPLVEIATKVPAHKRFIAKMSAALAPRMRMANEINPSVLSRDAEIGRAYAADPLVGKMVSTRWFSEALKAMDELKRSAPQIIHPVLVMHGSEDKLANVEATKNLFVNVGSADKRMKIYEGYYHELFNEPEKQEIYERVTDWLELRSF
jgi:alpha-beta hydrolase superfamily lysophospholipase